MYKSRKYEDLLEGRRREKSNFLWISRSINPQIAFKQERQPTPTLHKEEVLQSQKIQELLDKLSLLQKVPKGHLEKQVKIILEEIGYNKKLKVIRWLGLVLTKICLKVCNGIYINADKVQQIRSAMGGCPVIFVPSHRSYADFILMSYMCYTYDIAIPAIAAGMDFHGMWGMGTMLRDTGAFFMRRSYNDDSLYWTVFKQYVYQLVTRGDLPIEFFIEGTRSRSNKSLTPKFGLISMILKAYFFAEVPDVLFVPISISYDRILEESLFSYELLGVPKPKETTSGFFKSLRILKEHFGSIYFHLSEPISAREFFGDSIDRNVHGIGPLHSQELTEREKNVIPSLTFEILLRQQEGFVITVFNLVALILNNIYASKKKLPTVEELEEKVKWLKMVVESLGAYVHDDDTKRSLRDCLLVHKNLIQLNPENQVSLVRNEIRQGNVNILKLKAHQLSDRTMTYSVPFVMLQIYVNPTLFYLIDVAIISIIITKEGALTKDELLDRYAFLRSLYAMEFIIHIEKIQEVYERAVEHCTSLEVVRFVENKYRLGENVTLQELSCCTLKPFLMTYSVTCTILQNAPLACEQKTILSSVQRILEDSINDEHEFVHPYTLNLDTLSNCINSLSAMSILKKVRRDGTVTFEVNKKLLIDVKKKLDLYIPKLHTNEGVLINLQLQNKL